MTNDEMTRVLGRLTAGFDKRLSDDTYGIWREELEPLDFSPAYAAAREIIKTSKFFPSISEFIHEHAKHTRRQAGPTVDRKVCNHCDLGWQNVDPAGREVIPCSACRPGQFDYWGRGELPPTLHPPTHSVFLPRDGTGDPTAAEISIARSKLLAMRDAIEAARPELAARRVAHTPPAAP